MNILVYVICFNIGLPGRLTRTRYAANHICYSKVLADTFNWPSHMFHAFNLAKKILQNRKRFGMEINTSTLFPIMEVEMAVVER